MTAPALLRGVDRSAFAVSFALRLRVSGVTVGFTAIDDFVRALVVAPPDTKQRLYWTARVTLVRRHAELAVFDAVFAAVFDDAVLALDPNARRRAKGAAGAEEDSLLSVPRDDGTQEEATGLPWVTRPPVRAPAEDSSSTLVVPERLPSDVAGLIDLPFESLSAADLALLGRWLETAARDWPTRRTRRMAPHSSGHRLAIRPTLARSRRTGWEPIQLVHTRVTDRPRRVVMLCDVSQSMQAQTTAYLHLMRALAVTVEAEVFAFSTTLTRLTTVLTHRSPDDAITQASAKVSDRFGGTRIATNLRTLLASHYGGLLRGAVVIVASDGWDSDPPPVLAAAMARLARRAQRVIWINPRAAAPGFAPQVSSMVAALPYCDELLAADTFASLVQVIGAIASPIGSRASRGSRAGTGRR